jgi:hypothetical protein
VVGIEEVSSIVSTIADILKTGQSNLVGHEGQLMYFVVAVLGYNDKKLHIQKFLI